MDFCTYKNCAYGGIPETVKKHAVLSKSYFNFIRECQILQQIESFKCIVLMIDKS